MYSNSIFPAIPMPTRITTKSAALIGNIFINSPTMLNSGLILSNIYDDQPILALLDIPICKSLSPLKPKPTQSFLRRQMKTSNIANLEHNLLNTDWTFINNYSNVNDDYDKFISSFKS